MKRIPLVVIAAVIALARAQSPAFEVASIKPFQGLPLNVYTNTSGPRVTISEYGLPGLLMTAYQVEPWQILGGPVWMETDRFNIVANAPGESAPTPEQVRQMLQTLLADRFQLKVHREKKEGPVYALVVDKKGSKLTPSTSADSTLRNSRAGSRTQDGFDAEGALDVVLKPLALRHGFEPELQPGRRFPRRVRGRLRRDHSLQQEKPTRGD